MGTGSNAEESAAALASRDAAIRSLAESEDARRDLEQILERIGDAFMALDKNWCFTYVNERAAAILRRPPDELVGKHLWTEFPQGVGQVFYNSYYDAMVTQLPRCIEERTRSGRWFENRIYPSPDGLTIFFQDVTDRRNRQDELRRVNQALKVLAECNRALARLTEESALLDAISRICVDLGGRRLAWVGYAVHDEGRTVRAMAAAGENKEFLQAADVRWSADAYGSGPTGTAIRTGQTVVMRNAADDPAFAPWRDAVAEYGLASAVSLPLDVEGTVIGALTIYDDASAAFDREEVALLEALAADLAYGIGSLRARAERERAQDSARREYETTRLLLDAARSLSATIDLNEILRRLADVALRFTGLSRAFVNLIDDRARLVRPMIATGGLRAHEPAAIGYDKLSRTYMRAIEDRKTVVLDYELPATPTQDREIARAYDSRLVLFVPLVVGDEVVGEISLDEPGERHQFTERQIELVEGIASEAAVIVRNAQLHQKTEEAARLNDALNSIDSSIHSTLEFDEVMQYALDQGLEALRCTAGAIELRRNDRWVVTYERDFPELRGVPMTDAEAPNATRIAASGGPLMIQDVTAEEIMNVSVGRKGLKSVLGVPFLLRGKLVGCALFYASAVRDFTQGELDFVGKLGASVSLALENARLYQSERELSERLHERDSAIRRAYVDVIDAVTGGRLVLMTREELDDAVGSVVSEPEPIECGPGMAEGRHRLRDVLLSIGRPPRDLEGIVLAASEAITNACKHGGDHGQWSVRTRDSCAEVVVEDFGGGIDFKTLPKATLSAGFSTTMSLGMGFTIMLEICDRVLLATEAGHTCIVLEMAYAERAGS